MPHTSAIHQTSDKMNQEMGMHIHDGTVDRAATTTDNQPAAVYKKRPGTTAVGQLFETKLLSMVLLRLLHNDQIKSFYLGNNLDEALAFDDIVLKTWDVQGRTRVQLLQAKHKKAMHKVNYQDMIDIKKDTGDFCLKKYMESYLGIRYSFTKKNDSVIFEGDYEGIDLELIIFTPAALKIPKEVRRDYVTNRNTFYTKETGKMNQIECTETLQKSFVKVCEQWYRNTVVEILAKLILFKNYTKSNLQEAIKKLQEENVLSELAGEQRDFSSNNLLNLYSNKTLKSFTGVNVKKLCENIANILDETLLPSYDECIEVVNDFFCKLVFYSHQATEDELDTIIKDDIKSKNHDNAENIYFKMHNIIQKWWKQAGQVPYLTKQCKILEIAINQVKLDERHSVCLEKLKCKSISFSAAEVVKPKWKSLYKDVVSHGFSFINIFSNTPKLCCIRFNQYFYQYHIDFKLIIIDNENASQSIDILKKANSQSLIVAYFPENNSEIIEAVCQVTKKLIIITEKDVGGNCKSIEDVTSSLIDLDLQGQRNLLETPVTFQDSLTPLRLILDNVPMRLIEGFTLQKLIYDNNLIISKSCLPVRNDESVNFYIERTLLDYRYTTPHPKSFLDITERVVIVAADPGMGKSTLLTAFARALKKSNCSTWIVRINLLDHSKQFYTWKKSNATLDKTLAFKFLIESTCNQTNQMESFEQQLFEWYCQHFKIVLLVDGFDEVSPDYNNIVLNLLQLYKKHFCEKLWVTTRSGNVQNELEEKLEVCSYSLLPFTEEDTKQFLRLFWGPQLEKFPQKLETYTNQFMSYMSKSIDQGEQQLTSVPLQAEMFATVFLEHFEDVVSLADQFKRLDLITLYEKCIDMKFNVILMEQKNKIDSSIPNNMHRLENDFKQFQNKHKPAAIYALFNQEDVEKLLDKKEIEMVLDFVQEVQSSIEKTGIVTRVVEDKLIFVHKTYAEFFSALFLWEKYLTLQDKQFETFIECLLMIILKNETVQIVNFLHGMAKKGVKSCLNAIEKSFILLKRLLKSADYWHKQNKEICFFLLGIVECSLEKNRIENIEQILNNIPDYQKDQLLLRAFECGYIGITQLITKDTHTIKTVQEMDSINVNLRFSPLHWAAWGNLPKIALLLLNENADVNVQARDGQTPLLVAISKDSDDIVEICLKNGANIECTKDGLTALYKAARNNFVQTAQMIIERGAFAIDNGESPLHIATETGHLEMVELLTNSGANMHFKNTKGWTALHLAARNNFIEIASMMIAKGADIDSFAMDNGETPLHFATKMGHLEMVELLTNLGANINHKNKEGWTALHLAARYDFAEIARILINSGANIDSSAIDNGETPLHLATKMGHLEMVELLTNLGANTKQKKRRLATTATSHSK